MIIKETCEDFKVTEIPLETLFREEAAQFHVYKLTKQNYTTQRAITHIAQALRIPRKFIGYAGTKDKKAITIQYITISGAKKDRVLALELKDLSLEFVGYRTEALRLGDLKGNSFSILVRDVELPQKTLPSTFYVPNYFDDQRFSSHNVIIGTHILKKEYKEAVEIIQEHDTDFQEAIMQHLEKQQNDYIGALRVLPKKTLLFFVHAVQSFLFNEELKTTIQKQEYFGVNYSQGILSFPKQFLESVDETQEGELIGFDSKEAKQGIEPYDFLNKSLPELALAGATRPLYSHVTNCKLLQEEQGVRVEFSLSKGCYATIVLKQLFSEK